MITPAFWLSTFFLILFLFFFFFFFEGGGGLRMYLVMYFVRAYSCITVVGVAVRDHTPQVSQLLV